MPLNGSGTYSAPALPGSWNPASSGSIASPTDWNTLLADISTALSTMIAKDGQTTVTANLPMAGFRHTGVSNATARDSYASAGQVQDGSTTYIAAGGTADAITLTLAPAITAYAIGQTFRFKASGANTVTNPTINVNGVGAGTIFWPNGAALAAGDIPANALVSVTCSTTTPVWHLQTVSVPGLANTTVAASRVNLKIDSRTTVADAIYTVLSTDYLVAYTSLSAARTVTLPAASTFNAGRRLVIIDESGSASQTNAISLAPNGADTIAGSNTTQVVINIPRGRIEFECNGSNGWHVVGPWSVRYVSTLAADVVLNNTGTYFDVLSIAQGTAGTWRARVSGTFLDTATANASFGFKLTDGTTTFRQPTSQSPNNNGNTICIECEATNPAGNLKLQALDASSINGLMKANPSGSSATATQMIVERIA